jgi:hypothetical protein
MKNNKYINYFIIVCIILLILIFSYYIFFKNTGINENEINKLLNIENFASSKYKNSEKNAKDTEYPINMIENGSFENGKNIKNNINQDGYNKIIKMKNPSKSSYVLEQKISNDLTYYELISNSIPNSKFVILFWISFENKNIEDIDILSLLRVRLRSNTQTNNIPKLNYNIVQKIEIDNRKWFLLQYNFITDQNTSDKMNIYINYTEKLQDNIIYFAGISMYRILSDAQNFIYNNGLVCYLDAYQYESNSTTWHDLSGFGNDFFWDNIPITDYTKGFINMSNLDLKGNSSNILLNNNEFTIIIVLNEDFENNNTSENRYLLTVPGNNKNSFELSINKDNKLLLHLDKNKKIVSTKEVEFFNKSIIIITYKDSEINIYKDGKVIISTNTNKFYFNTNKVIFNKNKDLNMNVYGVLVYNRIIQTNEIEGIRDYFITNSNKDYNNPNINNYQMDNNLYNNHPINTASPYYNTINTQEQYKNISDDIFGDTFSNQYNDVSSCAKNCQDMCRKFLDSNNGFDKYKECINGCKNVIYECKTFCEDNKNKNSIYCNNNSNNCNNDNIEQEDDNLYDRCPIAYKKDGKYYVYIFPNTKYANEFNYRHEKSYGSNMTNAKNIYSKNFPDCKIPTELLPGGGKNYLDSCPYTLKESNPCYSEYCSGVNWNVDNYDSLKMNDKCKKSVSNYCHINYDIDENCACWNPKYKNEPKCIKLRKFFENPNDYCAPESFNIEDHPDFSKYIKKDKIPCWGCNIESPENIYDKK